MLGGLVLFRFTDGVLLGGSAMAVGCLVAAVLRAVRPADSAGGLHVRSRNVDVAMMTAAGIAVAVATFLVHAREGV